MNFWNQQDLHVMDTRDKIISLKKEFNNKFGEDIDNYSKRLNSFVNRRLKKESDLLLKRHFIFVLLALEIQKQNIYK